MNPKVNYLLVGLFVIAVGIATVIFALWLAFGYGEPESQFYMIYMRESVAGLSEDSAVKFNGVNVGTIKDIQLSPHDPSIVMIKIAVRESTPVTVDTRATLMSQGLTGLSFINLSGGDERSSLLKPAKGQMYAVIPTSPSLFVRMDTSLNQLSTSLEKISKSVDYLLRDENQKNVTTILQNMSEAAQTINAQSLPVVNESMLMMNNALPSASRLLQELANDPSILLRGQKEPPLGPGETAHG